MKVSKIVATLSGVTELVDVKGEAFYDTNLILGGESYPARLPKYLKDAKDKCEIQCTVATGKKDEKMFTYLNVLTAERLENQDTPDSNTFCVGGVVQKNKGLIPIPSKGTVSLSLVLNSTSGVEDITVNTIHLTCTDKIARDLVDVSVKSILEVNGYLKSVMGCLYVHITEVLYKRERK